MTKLTIKIATVGTTALGLALLTPASSFADNNINTGSSNVTTKVSNNLNSNFAKLTAGGGSANINVSGNGHKSHNTVKIDMGTGTSLNQSNSASVWNSVSNNSNTGANFAFDNTQGLSSISTSCLWPAWMNWCH